MHFYHFLYLALVTRAAISFSKPPIPQFQPNLLSPRKTVASTCGDVRLLCTECAGKYGKCVSVNPGCTCEGDLDTTVTHTLIPGLVQPAPRGEVPAPNIPMPVPDPKTIAVPNIPMPVPDPKTIAVPNIPIPVPDPKTIAVPNIPIPVPDPKTIAAPNIPIPMPDPKTIAVPNVPMPVPDRITMQVTRFPMPVPDPILTVAVPKISMPVPDRITMQVTRFPIPAVTSIATARPMIVVPVPMIPPPAPAPPPEPIPPPDTPSPDDDPKCPRAQPKCEDEGCAGKDGRCTVGSNKGCNCELQCPDFDNTPFCEDCGGEDQGKCKGIKENNYQYKHCDCVGGTVTEPGGKYQDPLTEQEGHDATAAIEEQN